MILRVLPEAQGEAIEAAVWYEGRQRLLGEEFLDEIETAFERIRQGVDSLSPMEQYSGRFDIRRILLRRFPYAVIVLRRLDETLVVAIAHTRRRPLYWLDRVN
jgi:toxin ParE1/3/4